MNSKKENNQQPENYIDENGVLVMIGGGVIPGSPINQAPWDGLIRKPDSLCHFFLPGGGTGVLIE